VLREVRSILRRNLFNFEDGANIKCENISRLSSCIAQIASRNQSAVAEAVELLVELMTVDALQRGSSSVLRYVRLTADSLGLTHGSPILSRAILSGCRRVEKLPTVPAHWNLQEMISGVLECGGTSLVLSWPEMPELVLPLQGLLDRTHCVKYTRDRKGETVPNKLVLQCVEQIQNPESWSMYMQRRQELLEKGTAAWPQDCAPCLTSYITIPELAPSLALDERLCEKWLFHGCPPKAAQAITEDDFRIQFAGSNAGTLFGKGIYCAESCTKSDEYTTSVDGKWNGLRCIILCRVLLGRVQYCGDLRPDVDYLVSQCLSGSYDSVLGDREKTRNTFREFIVYDDRAVYPSYVLWYRRGHT